MCWNVAQGYVLLFLPPWPAGSQFSFPFSLLFEQMGLGKRGKESHSVLINSPHTQTQTWPSGTQKRDSSLSMAIETWCSVIQRKPGEDHITISMRQLTSEITFIYVFINTFAKICAYVIYNTSKYCVCRINQFTMYAI